MKSGSVFWGVLLITLGAFFLLYNFSVELNLSPVLDLWPLVLVVWGVSLLKISPIAKNILSGISGLLLGLLITALVTGSWRGFQRFDWDNSFFTDDESEFYDQADSMFVELDSAVANASINFAGGAGEFKIKGGSDYLADFHTLGNFSSLKSTYNEDNTSAEIFFAINSDNIKINKLSGRAGDIRLNNLPVWDITLKVGAAEFGGDLTGLKVRKMTISAGAADISLKLDALLDSSYYMVETGVANVEILVPEFAGCQIKTMAGLSAKDFKGFNKQEKRAWRTDNFYSADKKLYLVLKGGMSNFEVKRY